MSTSTTVYLRVIGKGGLQRLPHEGPLSHRLQKAFGPEFLALKILSFGSITGFEVTFQRAHGLSRSKSRDLWRTRLKDYVDSHYGRRIPSTTTLEYE
ncbi:hypothetical protein SAMN02745126_04882 [Enhydrobacter aerosaccus]|uniref:Uncharacterized protein n=1 Tax=Enhydrobacter aerosaccus TaxID=225324 RepID=A0A1T4SPG4_9HYPH|nr:hypothetical protein [Enhydrobacter aerosaccus]SKA30095.1 hypothetical protein SAMN02745126_04882 [Enhydrobacter aerosaccus]